MTGLLPPLVQIDALLAAAPHTPSLRGVKASLQGEPPSVLRDGAAAADEAATVAATTWDDVTVGLILPYCATTVQWQLIVGVRRSGDGRSGPTAPADLVSFIFGH